MGGLIAGSSPGTSIRVSGHPPSAPAYAMPGFGPFLAPFTPGAEFEANKETPLANKVDQLLPTLGSLVGLAQTATGQRPWYNPPGFGGGGGYAPGMGYPFGNPFLWAQQRPYPVQQQPAAAPQDKPFEFDGSPDGPGYGHGFDASGQPSNPAPIGPDFTMYENPVAAAFRDVPALLGAQFGVGPLSDASISDAAAADAAGNAAAAAAMDADFGIGLDAFGGVGEDVSGIGDPGGGGGGDGGGDGTWFCTALAHNGLIDDRTRAALSAWGRRMARSSLSRWKLFARYQREAPDAVEHIGIDSPYWREAVWPRIRPVIAAIKAGEHGRAWDMYVDACNAVADRIAEARQ